jgi:hypothetical protein
MGVQIRENGTSMCGAAVAFIGREVPKNRYEGK